MPEIRPFCGLRPHPSLIVQTVLDKNSLPDGFGGLKEGANPISFMHILEQAKPAADVEPNYEIARQELERFVREGTLIQDSSPCYYLFSVTYRQFIQHGLVASVAIADYEAGLIKKHEKTRTEREIHLGKFIGTLGHDATPVMLAYRARPEIDNLLFEVRHQDEPVYDVRLTGEVWLKCWKIQQPSMVERISNAFSRVESFYIADGHHRAAAVARLAAEGHGLSRFSAVLYPDNVLKVFPFYRRIKKGNAIGFHEAFMALNGSFHLQEINLDMMFYQFLPEHHFLLCTAAHSFLLSPRTPFTPGNDPVKKLDVSILQDEILAPYFGVNDPKTHPFIDFGSLNISLAQLKLLLQLEDTECLFISRAPLVSSLFEVADAGEVMPPKSTSFEPKVKSGIVLHPHE